MPQEVSAELRRVLERWRTMTPVQSEVGALPMRALVGDLARESGAQVPVPDLGPHVLPDQLAVVVHDACAAAVAGIPERLTQLRRAL